MDALDPSLLPGVWAVSCLAATRRARWIFGWEPARAEERAHLRELGLVSNPFRRGPFSYRLPFIVRSTPAQVAGVDLLREDSFDVQPFMQD